MGEHRWFVVFLLILSAVFSILSLVFSLWVYSFDYDSKLIAHTSSQADIGLTVETSFGICGNNACNSNENCTVCPGDCGTCPGEVPVSVSAGGGGGGSAQPKVPDFKLIEGSFNLKIVSGESETYGLIIENKGTTKLDIMVSAAGLQNYLFFDNNNINIAPGKSAPFNFTIYAPEPGVYAGKLIFTHQGITREALILINVISEGVLFDVSVTVPELYRVLRKGQRLPALIELLEIGAETGVDATINYFIEDFDGNRYYSEFETFYVFGTKSYSKRFPTTGLKPGNYFLGVELVYIGGFASSSVQFRISDSLITPQTWVAIISLLIALIVCILALLYFKHNKNKYKAKKVKY